MNPMDKTLVAKIELVQELVENELRMGEFRECKYVSIETLMAIRDHCNRLVKSMQSGSPAESVPRSLGLAKFVVYQWPFDRSLGSAILVMVQSARNRYRY